MKSEAKMYRKDVSYKTRYDNYIELYELVSNVARELLQNNLVPLKSLTQTNGRHSKS